MLEHSARPLKVSQVKVYVPSEPAEKSLCGRDLSELVSQRWVLHGGKKNEAVLLASNLSIREYSRDEEGIKKNI